MFDALRAWQDQRAVRNAARNRYYSLTDELLDLDLALREETDPARRAFLLELVADALTALAQALHDGWGKHR